MLLILAIPAGILLLLLLHRVAWSLIPSVDPRTLAKSGEFVSIHGIDIYYETYGEKGEGPAFILIPAGGSHTSTYRFNASVLEAIRRNRGRVYYH